MRRFLKWKWIVRIGLFLTVLACLLPCGGVFLNRYIGQTEVAKIVAKLDAEDPNWKLDDLANELNAKLPPPERNPATIVEEAKRAIPAGTNVLSNNLPDLSKLPINCLPEKNDQDAYTQLLKLSEPALKFTRLLIGAPEGGRQLQYPRNPLTIDLTQIQEHRKVAALIKYDALSAAYAGRPNDAVPSARAAFGVPRAIGSEPMLISQLVRMATDAIGASTVERILNLGEPTEGLAELQADLVQQSNFPYLRESMRGERASVHRMFEIIDSGEINNTPGGGIGLPMGNSLTLIALRIDLPADHAFSLRMMTGYTEAGKLPPDQQHAATKAVPTPQRGSLQYKLTQLLSPAVEKVTEASLRSRGKLAATAVGVACERYRQKFGQWPLTLDMIPKDILSEIPNDPFTGKPINYKRLPDGIVVYTIGPDLTDDGGLLDDPITNTPGKDFGIRIYDPALRRQPAPAKPVEEAEPEMP